MSSPKISLIVPIYNTLQFLDRCLSSIRDQTFKDFEVILIIDGSPDDSESFCKEFIKNDSRFILKVKENEGLASARNYGMSFAKGEFISFIDSDDYISLDYCEILYNTIKENDVDIIDFGLTYVKENEGNKRFSIFKKNKTIGSQELFNYLKNTSENKILWFVNKFFKREFLLNYNIKFDSEIKFGDDSIFNLKCFYNAKSLYSIDKALYYYVYNPMSITQVKYKPNLLSNIEVQFDKRINYHQSNKELNQDYFFMDIAKNYINHSLFFLFSNLHHSNNENRISELKKIRNSSIYKFGFKHYKSSNKVTFKMKVMIFLFQKKYYYLLDKLIWE